MKSIDVRLVIADQLSPEDAVRSIVEGDNRFFGAQTLQNDGFGHSFASGPGIVTPGGAQGKLVDHKLKHPDTNWADGTVSQSR